MGEKVIDVAFIYIKLSPSIVLDVDSNRILSSTSINEDGFTMKDSEYFFDAAPSEMDNYADTHVFGRNFRVYFTIS